MKITCTNTGEVLEAVNPNADTEKFLHDQIAKAFLKLLRNEIALASAHMDKLKPGHKKVFLTKPVRIVIEK